MAFELHPRLESGSHKIGRIGNSWLLLKNNAIFPWFLLVPEVEEGVEDLHQLELGHYEKVMSAVRVVSEFVSEYFDVEKLNVGCIGNQVRQMHIHVVGRSSDDPAWPGTVWAFGEKRPYSHEDAEKIAEAARAKLSIGL